MTNETLSPGRILEILAAYDDQQRRTVTFPGAIREEVDGVIRHVATSGIGSAVLFADLAGRDFGEVIRGQIAYFCSRRQDFEWKVFEHDGYLGLEACLVEMGFQADEPETLVALDLQAIDFAPVQPPRQYAVRRIRRPVELEAIARIRQEVWGTDTFQIVDRLASELAATPDDLSVYIVEYQGLPVSAGWMYFASGDFAGLWGGSTLPAYRGQGCYRALVAARVWEAQQRGKRYVTVDAGAMSCPILEKLGFRPLTITTPYLYHRGVKE